MRIILASKSGVRKKILDDHNIKSDVIVSNVDEDEVKNSLLAEGANPLLISKNLAEIKSLKVSNKNPDRLVIGADSVISLQDQLINKHFSNWYSYFEEVANITNAQRYNYTDSYPNSAWVSLKNALENNDNFDTYNNKIYNQDVTTNERLLLGDLINNLPNVKILYNIIC